METGNKFTYKKLSAEEQKARGILGRLEGIIADTVNPTRNGRTYSRELWEKVFDNDIMKEKIANRCCFGEIGHPADREETDPEKIAICLAEQPKFGNDGKIYGVFDILSTPCGQILKSLCDYGCNIGISSRGTGDLIQGENGEEVDPDTYNCECWDAVLIPAVKEARLAYVHESLEKTRYNKTLKQSLTESINKADLKDQKIMEDALNNIGIKINENYIDSVIKKYGEDKAWNLIDKFSTKNSTGVDDFENPEIQASFEAFASGVHESLEESSDEQPEDLEESFDDEWSPEDRLIHNNTNWEERNYRDLPVPDDSFDGEVTVYYNDREPEKRPVHFIKYIRANDIFPPYYAAENDGDIEGVVGPMFDGNTHGLYDVHDRYEDQVTYNRLSENMEVPEELDEGTEEKECILCHKKFTGYGNNAAPLANGLCCDDCNTKKVIPARLKDSKCNGESCADKNKEAVVDDKTEELASSLSESLLEVKRLKKENLDLQKKLSVCNAKETELTEQLANYKSAVGSLSNKAIQSKKLAKSLSEKNSALSESKSRIAGLKKTVNNLSEQLDTAEALNKEYSEKVESLNESLKSVKKQLDSNTNLLNGYRKSYSALKEHYLEVKATNYGLKKEDVLNKLNESYQIRDIDKVCEELSKVKSNMNKLPFNLTESTHITVKGNRDSLSRPVDETLGDDYVSDSLLRLADIK